MTNQHKAILAIIGISIAAYWIFKDDSNYIPGGKGDELDEEDVDQDELMKGIEVEMEHTTSKKIAKEIALDHLSSCPNYYSLLLDMEKENECD